MEQFEVTKYTKNKVYRYGVLPETDVKAILKGYTYDSDLKMWFNKSGNIGYDVKEIKEDY